VGWFGRSRRAPPGGDTAPPTAGATRDRASPGLATYFQGVPEGTGLALLDLGLASDTQLKVYGRFARRARFAGLLPDPPLGERWTEALESLPPNPDRPYDLVLAWDVLDRIGPEARPRLVQRLAELTAPGARLFTVVNLSGGATVEKLRFSALDEQHVREQVVGPPLPSYGHLLPAQLERLLRPFEVVHAYTLRSGLREYVSVRGLG